MAVWHCIWQWSLPNMTVTDPQYGGLSDSLLTLQTPSLSWQKLRQLANEDGDPGAFSRATKISRKQRKDYRGWGRRVAIDYWHKATRLDTNVNKKKRNREVRFVALQTL